MAPMKYLIVGAVFLTAAVVLAGMPSPSRYGMPSDFRKETTRDLARKLVKGIPVLDLTKFSKEDLTKIKKVSVFPSVVGALSASSTPSVALGSICKEGHFVFVNKWESTGSSLLKINVSTPATPVVALSTPPAQLPSGAAELFEGCYVSQGLIYVATWGGMKLFATNDLFQIGHYDFTFMPSLGVTLVSGVPYLYTWPGIHLVSLNVNPYSYYSPPVEYSLLGTIPTWSGSVNDPPASPGFSSVRAELSDNLLFIAGKPGVTRLYIPDASAPVVSGSFSTPNTGRDLVRYDDYVIVTGRGSSLEQDAFNYKGYTLVKVFGPNQGPKIFVPFYELGSGSSIYDDPNGMAVDGDYVYIAAGNSGLLVYHMDSIPSADYPIPSFAGRCEMDCPARDVVVEGNYAYVSCGNGGLRICQGIH